MVREGSYPQRASIRLLRCVQLFNAKRFV